MEMIQDNEGQHIIINDDGEVLAIFDRKDDEAAVAYFISLLSPDQLMAWEEECDRAQAWYENRMEEEAERRFHACDR